MKIKKIGMSLIYQIILNLLKKKVEYLKNYNNIWIWGGSTKGVMFLKHLSDLRPDLFKKISGVIDINKKNKGYLHHQQKLKFIHRINCLETQLK